MSSTSHVSGSFGPASGLAPLRAKSGWIVALGVVYVVAGIIALGSVVLATVATVWVVLICFLFMLPQTSPVTAHTFNLDPPNDRLI